MAPDNINTSKKADVNVASYQQTASFGGWSGAGNTLWAISTVGVVAGALIGAVVPFAPVIITASTMGIGAALGAAASAIPASMAVFSATGLSMGIGGGLMLGRISGSVAAVAKEQEKRLKEWDAKKPGEVAAQPSQDKTLEAPVKNSFLKRVRDTYYTYMNPKVGMTMMALGAVGGLIMAAAFLASGGAPAMAIMPALGKIVGSGVALSAPVVTAYCVGVGAAFGGLWNFNMAKVTTDTTMFFNKLIGGELYDRKWGVPAETKSVEQPAPAKTAETICDMPQRKFTDQFSLSENHRERAAREGQALAQR